MTLENPILAFNGRGGEHCDQGLEGNGKQKGSVVGLYLYYTDLPDKPRLLWSDHREQEFRTLEEDKEQFKQKMILQMLRLLWELMGYRKMGRGTLIHDLTVQL